MSATDQRTPATGAHFALLCQARAALEDAVFGHPTTAEEAVKGIEVHLDWLHTNLEEGDSAVTMAKNLASLVAATSRAAAVLLREVSAEEMEKAIAEVLS